MAWTHSHGGSVAELKVDDLGNHEYNVGKATINHPWLGMVEKPPIDMVIWGMVYDILLATLILLGLWHTLLDQYYIMTIISFSPLLKLYHYYRSLIIQEDLLYV